MNRRSYCVLGMMLLAGVCGPAAYAANIITFGQNANACGSAVMCSTNGTAGYLNNGTGVAFNLSTISQWFQIDPSGVNHLATQTMAEPDGGAGGFRVVNDTGATVTSFSLTLTDTFTSSTASVHTCTGAQAGQSCDNFQAQGQNNWNTMLSGPNWDKCTQGTTVGNTCTGAPGGVAADFAPNSVTYSWSGGSIAAGQFFDISFASWNNDAFANGGGGGTVPEPASVALLGSALLIAVVTLRKRFSRSAG